MVAAEIEEISGRNLDRVGDQRLALERRLRRGDSGLEQRGVAQPTPAAVCKQDLPVNRDRLAVKCWRPGSGKARNLGVVADQLRGRSCLVGGVVGRIGVSTIVRPRR
jgi:hypothetical protein